MGSRGACHHGEEARTEAPWRNVEDGIERYQPCMRDDTASQGESIVRTEAPRGNDRGAEAGE